MNVIQVNDIEFRLNHTKKTATVCRILDNRSVVVIPKTVSDYYNEFTVTAIKGSAFANSYVETVTLPSTIIKIGNRAFAQCHRLEKLCCDNAELMQIGQFAFAYCEHLQYFEISGPILLAGEVFYHCRQLDTIALRVCGEVANNTFANCYNLRKVQFTSNEDIKLNQSIFWGCNNLEELQINGGVYGCFDALDLAYSGVKVFIGGNL